MDFNDLVNKAVEQLGGEDSNYTQDTAMLRGIGYALLALATAIKESKQSVQS